MTVSSNASSLAPTDVSPPVVHDGAVDNDRRGAHRITYISWAESCSRSDHTARELGGRSHMVYAAGFGSHPATILFKYAVQWMRTSRILRAEKPDTVFVMTPPVFAALPAFWYAWRHRKKVVLDAHSAAFVMRRWRYFLYLQRALCRRAVTTLVSNEHLAGIVRGAGGHATVVPDVPVLYSTRDAFPRSNAMSIAVVCSFDFDEPVDAIFDAAAQLPDVSFYVTGNAAKLTANRRNLASNVRLTGFLELPAYAGLLTSADAVMALTTLDYTMLRGAYEAIYQGTPVIVSDWPILREAFPEGAVHVDNSAASIVNAVRMVAADRNGFRAGALRLREAKLRTWKSTRLAIVRRIGDARTETSLHRDRGEN